MTVDDASAAVIRPAAVAGTFYPAAADDLRSVVRAYLEDAHRAAARTAPPSDAFPRALIVPHAGYIYSGSVAARAYALLDGAPERPRRVLLLGPAHRARVRGVATTSATHFETPLGRVAIDRCAADAAPALPHVVTDDMAHAAEHSLEVQLPFLQCTLADFTLLPLAVGDAAATDVAEVIERVWRDDEWLVVVSSDLSHYFDYETARELDARTTQAIESLDADALGASTACGRVPIQALLRVARSRGLVARTLDVRSSGDTAGPRDEVVGYGAWAFDRAG